MRDKNIRSRKSKLESRQVAPANFLIVCEGKQTEPNYFNGLKQKINEKYGQKVDVLIPNIEIKGTGLNTNSLVEYTKKVVNQSSKIYGQVWVVFDKDDYQDAQFEKAINTCEYGVAWSNPNFELWLLAHLKRVTKYVSKDDVLKELEKAFKENGLGTYKKNDKKIFEKLTADGKIKEAIKNCKQMEKQTCEYQKNASRNPTTMVYKIVEGLEEYL